MKRGAIIDVEITDFAFGGKGIAKIPSENGDFILFVQNTIPGQVVQAKITKKKKRFAECNLVKVLTPSPLEQSMEYQPISGAPYATLPIEIQEKYKRESCIELYKRIGGIQNIESVYDGFISSPLVWNYRNKMEYSFSCIEHDIHTDEEIDDAFALGFKHRGTWWKVEDLAKESGLFDAEWENKLHLLTVFLKETGLPAWHPPRKEGFFRHVVVRKSFYQDQLLINLVTSSQGIENFDVNSVSTFLQELLGNRLAGFQHTVNDDVADRAKIENGYNKLVFGAPKVVEQICGLEFEISMESFFQTNPTCAELLYNKAMEYAFEGNSSGLWMMDLFCGTGTIAQLMAQHQPKAKIIGVDIVKEAIIDAKKNATRNGIHQIEFHAADVGKFLLEFPEYKGKIGTIMLDPPRAGIAPKSLKRVIELGAKRIVYISCNPSTQARDAAQLLEAGYELKKLSLVDQFPHTAHVEAVAWFEK